MWNSRVPFFGKGQVSLNLLKQTTKNHIEAILGLNTGCRIWSFLKIYLLLRPPHVFFNGLGEKTTLCHDIRPEKAVSGEM